MCTNIFGFVDQTKLADQLGNYACYADKMQLSIMHVRTRH